MNYVAVLIRSFLISLVLTIIIEEIVAFFMGSRKKLEFIIVALVNALTNPAVVLYYVLVSRQFPDVSPLLLQIPGEIVVVIVEAYVYHRMGVTENYSFRRPVLLAVCANVISWTCGIILQRGGII